MKEKLITPPSTASLHTANEQQPPQVTAAPFDGEGNSKRLDPLFNASTVELRPMMDEDQLGGVSLTALPVVPRDGMP